MITKLCNVLLFPPTAYEAIVESCLSDSVEATRIAMGSKKEAVEATKQHTDKLKLAMGDLEVSMVDQTFHGPTMSPFERKLQYL